MSDNEDTPPPLPDSPPPPPMEDPVLRTPPPKRRTSDKILALQKQIKDNGGLGMYSSPGESPAPPPYTTPATSEDQEPPKLSHITKSRPKRNVRPPSRSRSTSRDEQNTLGTASNILYSFSSIVAVEEEEIKEEEGLTPPPPISAPPGAPPSPPQSDIESLDEGAFELKESPPTTSTPIEVPTAKPLLKSTWSDVLKPNKPETDTVTVERSRAPAAGTPTSVQTKAIVIGSFSDRLKKLRERRAAKTNSSSSLPLAPSPSTSQASLVPETNMTSNLSPSSMTRGFKTSTVELLSRTQILDNREGSPPVFDPSVKTINTENLVSLESKEDAIESDEDELPPAPPPPIPDLPPPSEEVNFEQLADYSPPKQSSTLSSKVSFRTLQRKEDWKRKSEQLQLDSFKSNNLPLLGADSVQTSAPLNKIPAETKSYPSLENSPSSQSVHKREGSIESDSLPSIPDSLPPDLPEAPPPDIPSCEILPILPDTPPPTIPNTIPPTSPEDSPSTVLSEPQPNLPQAQHSKLKDFKTETKSSDLMFVSTGPPSFRSLETSTPNSKDNEDYSLSVVKLRERKASPSSESNLKRRSAFDVLVTVEPTAEEKEEPKLTLEEKRKLAIMASRLSSADTATVQQVWARKAASSHGTPATNTPKTSRLETESLASKSRESEPNYSMDSLKLSQLTSKSGPPDTRFGSLNERRPSPVSIVSSSSHYSTPHSLSHEELNEPPPKPHGPPPGTEGFHQIRVISEGTPPSSPDVRYTRVAKENWSPKLKQAAVKRTTDDDDLSASASTGNIRTHLQRKKKKKLEKTSSLTDSLRSSNESPKVKPSLPWSIFKKSSSKKAKTSRPISPLAAASVTNVPAKVPKSPTSISLDSDDSGQESTQKFFPDDFSHTSSTFTGTISSKENLLTKEIPERDSKQEEKMEKQLVKVRDQRRMLKNLRRDPVAFLRSLTPRGSPQLRPASLILGTDLYKVDPAKWSNEQVCRWLELVGLGSYREVFRGRNVTGKRLLQMDIQLFDELDIDSPEIREIFLAKIYELSNPSSALGELEDDFKLSVDEYTSEDWKKFKAALSALKGDVLDDTIELEASAISDIIYTKNMRSQSTPNFTELENQSNDVESLQDHDTLEQSRMPVSRTAFSLDQTANTRIHHNSDLSQEPHSYFTQKGGSGSIEPQTVGETLTSEWVAGLPKVGRKRALTDPPPTISITYALAEHEALPHKSKLSTTQPSSDSREKIANEDDSIIDIDCTVERKRSSTTNQCLVKLFMNTVQEGALYKSFLVSPSTTTEELIKMAMDKANLGDSHISHKYTIWDRDKNTASRSSFSRQLRSDECPMVVQSQWQADNTHFFELRLKEGLQLHPTPQKRKMSTFDTSDFEAQIRSLTKEKNHLLGELSLFHSELQEKKIIEQQLEMISEECAAVKAKYKSEQLSHFRMLSEMEGRIQQLQFEKTKLEDQLSVVSMETSGEAVSSKVLVEMQAKYTKSVQTLERQLKEIARENEDLKRKNISLDQKVAQLSDDSAELKKVSRLLGEHQKQLNSAEQKLAEKEEAIHSLRGQLDWREAAAQQALALQQTLQALETTSKQQQNLSNRTVQEMKEQVSRLTAELGKKEQQMLLLKKERDRLTRERQLKDNVATSLEADLASYRALKNVNMDKSERLLTLQRSVSVHEVALASLQSEYDKQRVELKEAEEEVVKLRDSLAKKEEQLHLLSSSQENSKSSLYSVLQGSISHQLVLAEITVAKKQSPEGTKKTEVERSLSNLYGIKVSRLLGNYVVSEVGTEAAKAGIQEGDRLLEIDGAGVAAMSQRELNGALNKQSGSGVEPLRVVVARQMDREKDQHNSIIKQGSVEDEVIEQYQKLNTSLSKQLEAQTTEVDQWRNECERLNSEIFKHSNSKKDRELELTYLEKSVQNLKTQLEESERARVQLQDTLDCLGDNKVIAKEEINEREKELISLVDATERAAGARIQQLEADNKKLIATLREHLVNTDHPLSSQGSLGGEQLTAASRSELLTKLMETEGELKKSTAYLDQLLGVVIDQEPHLLARVSEAQLIRDQNDDAYEDWC